MPKLTAATIKALFSRPATRPYPLEPRPLFPATRGELVNDITTCIFCRACMRVCPSRCITVDAKAGTWECDPFACVYCGVCVDACPTGSLSQMGQWRAPSGERQKLALQGTPPKARKKSAAKGRGAAPEADRKKSGDDS